MVFSCPKCHGAIYPSDNVDYYDCEDCHHLYHIEYLKGFVAGKMSAAKAMEQSGTAHNTQSDGMFNCPPLCPVCGRCHVPSIECLPLLSIS